VFCSTLRQAEHAAAEVALNELSKRGPSSTLAAKVLVSFVDASGNLSSVAVSYGIRFMVLVWRISFCMSNLEKPVTSLDEFSP